MGSLTGYFIENEGQVEDHVRYYAMGNPAVAFRDDGVLFVIGVGSRGRPEVRGSEGGPPTLSSSAVGSRVERTSYAYLIRFEGGRGSAPVGRGELPFESNFLLGNDPSRWRVGVQNFREVVYPGLYAGIDLAFHLSPDGLKYEIHVRPFADVRAIRMTVVGAGSLEVDPLGLAISTPFGTVHDSAPFSYQEGGTPVDCRFSLRAARSYGFDCPGRDPSRTLTIDPLVYSTFLGGSDDALFGYQRNQWTGEWEPVTCGQSDRGVSIDVDGAGNAYVLGSTCSANFPVTPGAFNTTYWKYWDPTWQQYFTGDPQQLFIAKLNPSGSGLVYATYLGGYRSPSASSGGVDLPASIAIDSAGNAYVAGTTLSSDYPTTAGAFQRSFTCWEFTSGLCFWNTFVTKLNAAGNGLVYSTYLAARGYQFAWSLAVDAGGSAYLAGETNSTDFPTTSGAFDPTFNSYYGPEDDLPDVFVTKLNPSGSGLTYSTFVGGAGWEWPDALALDASGSAYVTGTTNSSNFPMTSSAYDTALAPPGDAFGFKLNAAGSVLAYSTFLGGDGWESGRGIAVDASGAAYVTGTTNSTNFPTTPGALRTFMFGGRDAFVTKLNPSGSTLAYSTFLGGDGWESGSGIAVDASGAAYVTGETYSGNFPMTPDAFDTVLNGVEGFVSEFNAAGSGLLYSTFLGGSGNDDQGSSIRVDAFGIAYVTGWTNSSDFPTTPDAFDKSLAGWGDAFVVKLLPVTAADPPDLAITPADITFSPPAPARLGKSVTIAVTVHNIGGRNASNVLVQFYDGPPGGSNQIGGDQVLPFVERFYGSGVAAVAWTAGPLGNHAIWVVIDPSNTVPEKREDNNEASASLDVLPLEPDLTVLASDLLLAPAPPYLRGTAVQISATVRNVGEASSGVTTAQFHDGVPPSISIGSAQPVPSLAPGGTAGVSIPWTASGVGIHTICVVADAGNLAAEMNEANNTACIPAKVLGPPDLEPAAINLAPPGPYRYGSSVVVNVTVVNWGEEATGAFDVLLFRDANGNRRPEAGENITRSPVPDLTGYTQTRVSIPWRATLLGALSLCVDVDPPPGTVSEYNEDNNVRCASVEVQASSAPPTTSLVVGSPNYTAGVAYVTSATPLAFAVADASGSGILRTMYRVNSGAWWNYTATGPFTLAGEGEHLVEWFSEDSVGDVEPTQRATIRVDDTPPTISTDIGAPRFEGTAVYVSLVTPITLSAHDGGAVPAGLASLEYREGAAWVPYTIPFSLSGADGPRAVGMRATDHLGNTANANLDLVLDGTPPETSIAPGAGTYAEGTTFSLVATDTGSGAAQTEYSVDGAAWAPYATPFVLPVGGHRIAYRSSDRVDNRESVQEIQVDVLRAPSVQSTQMNLKTLLAMVFAAILATAGIRASRLRPWKGVPSRPAMLSAFAVTSLPFVLAEAGTGVLSLLTGFPSIPPIIGEGTAVDVTILGAGLTVALVRARGRHGRPQSQT